MTAACVATHSSAQRVLQRAASSRAQAPPRLHGRPKRGLTSKAAPALTSRPGVTPCSGRKALIDALQGEWGDEIGTTIKVEGDRAWFTDSMGPWTIGEVGGQLWLRDACMVGSAAAPVWKLPTGAERHWARRLALRPGGSEWDEAFVRFKSQRLLIRQRLQSAFADMDFDSVAALRSEWEQPSPTPDGLSEEQRSALVAGQHVVPGACFVHKKYRYRGVIIGCNPWCTYPAAWRAKWLSNLQKGEAQPFYHCIVDERDRPGKQGSYVAEENLEISNLIFPLEAQLADKLLVKCAELGAYLPGEILGDALGRQVSSSRVPRTI